MDEMRPTPRNPLQGALADALLAIADKTGGVGEFLGIPAMGRTVDRMSYGEPLTTGTGQARQMRPDTMESVLSLGVPSAKSPKAALGALLHLGAPGAGSLDNMAAAAAPPPKWNPKLPGDDTSQFGKLPKGGNLDDFRKALLDSISARTTEIQAKAAMHQWMYPVGTQLVSETTGKTYTIAGRSMAKRKGADRPVYYYTTPDGGKGMFDEDLMKQHKTLKPLDAVATDDASIKAMLNQIGRPK